MADFKSVLKLRRAADGTTRIQGDPPERHVFPASFLARELGALVEVTVTVRTDAGDVAYRMDGFEDDGANLTGWVCTLVEQTAVGEQLVDEQPAADRQVNGG